LLETKRDVFDAHHFFDHFRGSTTVVQIIKGEPGEPYLSLRLKLDLREISHLMTDTVFPRRALMESSRGMAIGEVTLPLLTAFQR